MRGVEQNLVNWLDVVKPDVRDLLVFPIKNFFHKSQGNVSIKG